MTFKFWMDVFQYSKPENLYPTTTPLMPKPQECKRYLISFEIPEFDADADHIIEAKVKEVSE